MSGEHPIDVLCATLVASRSGYYAWRRRCASPRQQANQALLLKIRDAHAQSRGTYGSPRIARALGCVGARHRIARLMRANGLQGRCRRRYTVRTTDSRHDEPIAPNLLAHTPQPTGPDQVWVSDITYVRTDEGWLYLAGVLDRWSRRLVGWAMHETLETRLAADALAMAVRQRRPRPGLLHHSDRGVQYASLAYRRQLAAAGLRASMSRKGNCYDNATIEAFWSTLKNELVYRSHFATRESARRAIFDYIEIFYNRSRIHSALGYQSPLDFESNLN